MSTKQLLLVQILLLAGAVYWLAGCTPNDIAATPTPEAASYEGDAEAGLLLFNEHCLDCHSATLPRGFVGPTLYEAGQRLTAEYIRASIITPHEAVSEGFEAGTQMPTNMAQQLTEQELANIIAYLLESGT